MKINKILLFIIFSILCFALFINIIFNPMSYSKKTKEITSEDLFIRKYIGLESKEYKSFLGENVTIAILDSGIDNSNSMFNHKIIKFVDFVNKRTTTYDDEGHGTFIGGIIGLNGIARGIAPRSKFVVLKVLDSNGECSPERLEEALKWLIDNAKRYKVKVANISFGIKVYDENYMKKFDEIFDELDKENVFIVASAGNDGPNQNTILFPGTNKNVITVGSIKTNQSYSMKDDQITNFSARGTKILSKPDIVTLGVDIKSYLLGGKLSKKSGTSFSTAIVSGVLAVLIDKYKNESFAYVKDLLMNSTYTLEGNSEFSTGNGEINFR